MPAVFPPWSNTATKIAVTAAAAGAFAVLATLMVGARTPWIRGQQLAPDQPVEFDHRHHTRDDGIDCLYCHNTAMSASTAGIPSTDKCMGCHDQIWPQSPMIEILRRSYFTGAPIPWNRVHRVPGFAYFNHSIHTNNGFGCSTCHGRVDRMPAVYQVAPLTMGWCLDCHRNPEKYIRPLDQITNMDWAPGGQQARIGAALVERLHTRKLTDCTTCHR